MTEIHATEARPVEPEIIASPAEIWKVVNPLTREEVACQASDFGGITALACLGQVALDHETHLKREHVLKQLFTPANQRTGRWTPKRFQLIAEGIAIGIKIGIAIERNRRGE